MKKLDVPQSGSQANTTASRNRFGQYNRTRAMPTQPRTAAQVQARGFLSTVSKAWASLTDAERLAWNNYAAAHTFTDSLGQSYSLTGHQAFVSVGTICLQTGQAVQTAVPDGSAVATPEFTITPTTAAGLLVKVTDAIPASAYFLCFASPPLSPGRGFNGDFRLVKTGVGTNAAAQTVCAASDLAAKYGSLVAGQKFFFVVQVVDGGNISANANGNTVLT